jgi:hypothetical protein
LDLHITYRNGDRDMDTDASPNSGSWFMNLALVHVDQVGHVKLIGSVRTAKNVSQEDYCITPSTTTIAIVQLDKKVILQINSSPTTSSSSSPVAHHPRRLCH